MNYAELRQVVTDLSVLLQDLNGKFEAVKKELDTNKGEEIKALVMKAFRSETASTLAKTKNRLSKTVTHRLINEVNESLKKTDLDSVGQVLGRIKKMSECEKLQVCEYVLAELQVKLLKKNNRSAFTGNLS